MYFGTKSYLKSTRNHTAKHARKIVQGTWPGYIRFFNLTRSLFPWNHFLRRHRIHISYRVVQVISTYNHAFDMHILN
jgi:hypothetical protein